MNKTELIKEVAGKFDGLSQATAKEIIDATFDTVIKGAVTDGECSISGIGKFVVSEVPQRTCRNPQSGEAIIVDAHNAIKFKPAKALKDTVR